ncbi:MAG: aminomethyl-transferring glycine dehydrogenase subunit GcvPB [Candidatus Palauibacterales bacterium]|nr:aminomethyl-transferring glycine dehydrogenase subunit GcvPB [Candidatus Palauibacterales bacterium]MDP2530971.1 aminomethyl-transferring glycine dehydrogenase subunit GcvPB [Candidatus Palauibacterales bacterium]MDP2583414.1 aminomethyl-transferring glycine dehydrogenase subunit GcvPB [Candidatus Palauibacterales bacterium]
MARPPFPFQGEWTPTIFERSRPGRRGTSIPGPDVPVRADEALLPEAHRRREPPRLPEVPEHVVVRHYTELSLKNHHVDRALYPLGSCTMKYNPKVNEQTARLPGFAELHPFTPHEAAQGALALMHELAGMLREVAGMDAVSLQPAAGAQGEMTGVLLMRAYHRARGDTRRKRVLIPDSAHGTNPATVALAGFDCVELPSDEGGRVDPEAVRRALGDDLAGMMLTNPNTLGVFESRIEEISRLVHGAGGLMYMDGANLNALMGVVRPGDMGYDIVHFNLHKTFSTPHGGGGPGAGPVAVKEPLARFLPVPHIEALDGEYVLEWDRPESIGKIHGFYGNFGVMVRAYTYIRMLGSGGVRETAEAAVLNNAYLSALLSDSYPLPYGRGMHESVFTGEELKKRFGVRTSDVAKRLLDYGFHAPTIYFPLTVPEALMTEPTETETKEELDRYVDALHSIAREAEEDPDLVRSAPHTTPVRRLDEGRAGRDLDVRWTFPEAGR